MGLRGGGEWGGWMRGLGGVVELFFVPAGNTYVAIMTSSTMISTVNLTLGYGR